MPYLFATELGLVEWANTVIAVLGLAIAIVALLQTRRSNAVAKEANDISRKANNLAEGANALSAKAVQMQEDESVVRLIVKPQMLCIAGGGEDPRPRPIVTIINLSAFPVTVEKIWWKTADPNGRGFFWKNPTVSNPFGSFPARLASRQALTAVGKPDSFKTVEDFLSVTAAVACTECGESIEGMTSQWKEHSEKVRAKGKLHWDDDVQTKG